MDWPPSVVRLALLGVLTRKELNDLCRQRLPSDAKYDSALTQVDELLAFCLTPNPDKYTQLIEDIAKSFPKLVIAIKQLLDEKSYIKADWLVSQGFNHHPAAFPHTNGQPLNADNDPLLIKSTVEAVDNQSLNKKALVDTWQRRGNPPTYWWDSLVTGNYPYWYSVRPYDFAAIYRCLGDKLAISSFVVKIRFGSMTNGEAHYEPNFMLRKVARETARAFMYKMLHIVSYYTDCQDIDSLEALLSWAFHPTRTVEEIANLYYEEAKGQLRENIIHLSGHIKEFRNQPVDESDVIDFEARICIWLKAVTRRTTPTTKSYVLVLCEDNEPTTIEQLGLFLKIEQVLNRIGFEVRIFGSQQLIIDTFQLSGQLIEWTNENLIGLLDARLYASAPRMKSIKDSRWLSSLFTQVEGNGIEEALAQKAQHSMGLLLTLLGQILDNVVSRLEERAHLKLDLSDVEEILPEWVRERRP